MSLSENKGVNWEAGQARRTFYLVTMTLGVLSGFLPTVSSNFQWFSSFYETLVPITLSVVAMLAVVLWLRPNSLRLIEWGIFGVVALYNLGVLFQILYVQPNPYAREYMDAYRTFSPLVYVWTFLAFGHRLGLRTSLIFVLSALLFATPYLFRLVLPQAEHDAVQTLLVTLPTVGGIYIVALYAFTYFLATSNKVRARAEAVAELAYKDQLTELPNRLLFDERLAQATQAAADGQYGFSLVFIDLDDFKSVNDSLGHQAGDLLLKEVAARFQAQLRPSDLLARVSGDEFAAILPATDTPEAVQTVASKLITALAAPADLKGAKRQVSASLGFVIYAEHSDTPDALLAHADQAMYTAKRQGKNGYHLYQADSGEDEPASARAFTAEGKQRNVNFQSAPV